MCDCVYTRDYDDATIRVMSGYHYNMYKNIVIQYSVLCCAPWNYA